MRTHFSDSFRQRTDLAVEAITEGFAATQTNIDSLRVEAREGHVETIERLADLQAGICNLTLASTPNTQDTGTSDHELVLNFQI